MKVIIEDKILAPILSILAASVFFANTVSQELEIYHGYYLLFIKQFHFHFLSSGVSFFLQPRKLKYSDD